MTRNAVAALDLSDMLLRDPTGALHERLGADGRASASCARMAISACGPSHRPSEAVQRHLRRILLPA